MFKKKFRKNKIRNANFFVEPDEIFLDSKNIQNFDLQQFEGRIEKPISKKSILFLGLSFLLLISIFSFWAGYLQINKGEGYHQRSLNNKLEKKIIFADRGIVYDRNKVELIWNTKSENEESFPIREYFSPGFSHLLGYVSYPMQDKSGNYWQKEVIGKYGIEKQYSEELKGVNGTKVVEVDVYKNIHSENIVNPPQRGADLITSIDSRIQKELFNEIKNISEKFSFKGGSGMIMDVNNGEIIISTSYPEYDSKILSLGKDKTKIQSYLTDKRNLFIDKNISGRYTPGSIVKPFLALGALNEKLISPTKKILSTGSISIPNPYFPGQETIFKDWKAHGWVDLRESIAVSSDVYFYAIGGGFEDQKGLGISKIEEYVKLFKIGEKTNIDLPNEINGVMPNPEWKAKNFKGEIWRLGDTYNTAIGQYGFQTTPVQMLKATAAIANYGKLLNPHILLNTQKKEEAVELINLNREDFKIVHEGMRGTVLYGTATILNVPYVEIAAKTGTAQLGLLKNRVNSWVVGFFPYQNPKYAFVLLMESGPANGTVSASYVMGQLINWMSINTPEYFK